MGWSRQVAASGVLECSWRRSGIRESFLVTIKGLVTAYP